MRLRIVAVGRLKAGPEGELVERYRERLAASGRAVGITRVETVELPEGRSGAVAERKSGEAAAVQKALKGCATVIAFDERGEAVTSRAFAKLLRKAIDGAAGDVGIVIGGADGLDDSLRRQADNVVSFGRMTLPHQLVRIMVVEQLYRAVTILTGHPYHRD